MIRPLATLALAAGFALAAASPAEGAERRSALREEAQAVLEAVGPAGWRIAPAPRRASGALARLTAMVPDALRPLVEARLNAGGRPKPGGTTMFEPSSLVPLWRPDGVRELGLAFGRSGRGRTGDRDRGTVVVVYVGAGF